MLYQPPFKYGATPAVPGIYNDAIDAHYVNGDPALGREGSYFPGEALEHPQRELIKLLTSSGITPRIDVLEQVSEATARYASGAVFTADSGAKNAPVLNVISPFVAPKGFFKGLRAIYYSGAGNDAASTVNAFGLGVKPLLDHTGAALSGGETITNRLVDIFYDPALNSGAGAWKLAPWANALLLGTNTVTINNYASTLPYVLDSSGAANTVTAVFSPALVSFPAGAVALVKFANTNTGPTSITINSLTSRSLLNSDGSELPASAIQAGQVALIRSDGTNVRLEYTAPRGFFARSTAAQSIPSNITTKVTDLAVVSGMNDFGSGALSGGVLTIPAGTPTKWYTVSGSFNSGTNPGGASNTTAVIFINDAQFVGAADINQSGLGSIGAPCVSTSVRLAAGDRVQLGAYHNSSSYANSGVSYLSVMSNP